MIPPDRIKKTQQAATKLMDAAQLQSEKLACAAADAVGDGDGVKARELAEELIRVELKMVDDLIDLATKMVDDQPRHVRQKAGREAVTKYAALRKKVEQHAAEVRQASNAAVARLDGMASGFANDLADIFGSE